MKISFKAICSIMFLSIFIFMAFPLQHITAATNTYFISAYTINVEINRDGSADIEERLTYNYSGQFNGALRNIDFSKTKGFINQKVYVIKNDSLQESKLNSDYFLDSPGEPGKYNFVKEDSLAKFKIFELSYNEEKTFVIKYKFNDVVTKYTDIAQFNRKLIDSGWPTRLDNVSIKIKLPEGASTEEIKVFAHGPLIGSSAILDSRNVEFTVPTVSPGTFVETLVLFPTKLVPDSKNIINEAALPGIMENERNLAGEANKIREQARYEVQLQRQYEQKKTQENSKLEKIGIILGILLVLLWFPIIIYIYLNFDKELKHSFEGKYYRELPGEYTPAEMSVLMSFGYVNTRDIMATLMDLVRKKQFILSSGKVQKKSLFGSKEVIQYVITLNTTPSGGTLKKHEQFLIDWFINKIGNGTSVSLDEIKDYVKTSSMALSFKADYDKWAKLAQQEADSNKFFDETSRKGRILGILTGIAYFGIGIVITIFLSTPFAMVIVLLGIFLLLFSARIKRRTQYGNEQYAMWSAFKNFLKEFSRMDKAQIPSIVIWEHYLVYAISLGVAKEVIKQLPIIFRDDDLNNNHLTFMYGASYGYFAGFSAMFDDTIHTVEGAISQATSIANSQNSSSSGSGGGFSGGSSGGGGGGGGGGAF